MKKSFFTKLFFTFLISTAGTLSAKDINYCKAKCTPSYCKAHPLQAIFCKEDCPHMFEECFKAVPLESQEDVVKGIEKVSGGEAAAEAD